MNKGLLALTFRAKNCIFFAFVFSLFSLTSVFAETITYTDSGGTNPRSSPPYAGGYTVHTFTATGTTNFTIPLNVTSIDYLVVGGGGGGGAGTGGGGGAGGMLTGSGTTTLYSGYTYGVTVGDGGRGGDASPIWYGLNGGTSTLGSFVTAFGGGGGGGNDGAEAGRNGGSGGGAGGLPNGSSAGSGTAGQGYSGGSYGSIQGGGGGGAGEAGSTDSSGYGGDGLQSSISGTATWYAGGGGGRNTGGSSGGTGGGGGEGTNGTNGTGGGGGGYFPTRGDGGSGIVILRYLTPDPNLAVLATSTSVSYVTESSATFSSSLISIGGASVTSRGICYGTTRYPTNCVAEGGTAIGDFSITLSNLATSTTYFYRSYATNSYGTSTSADGIFTTEGITNSLMFDSGSSQYLSRTFSTATDGKKWTYSFWVKRSMLYAQNNIQFVLATAGSGAQGFIGFGQANNSDEISFGYSGYVRRYTNMQFRDPSAWQHVVLRVDTATSSEADRAIFYVNGVQVSMVTPTTISQNDTTQINQAVSTLIGNQTGQAYGRFDGYLSDTNFIDGQALAPDYFGRPDPNTGNWVPKAYQGTYGVNGFHLNFSSSTALGYDTAPLDSIHTATNTWTTNGGMSSTTNQVIDTPLNNFATFSSNNSRYYNGTIPVYRGGLRVADSSDYCTAASSFGMTTGKWYYEIKLTSDGGSGYGRIGIQNTQNRTLPSYPDYDTKSYVYTTGGNKILDGTSTSYGNTFTSNDLIGVAFDADNSTLTFYKNGLSQGTINNIPVGTYIPIVGDIANATNFIWDANFGQRPFTYTPPTGFKPLSTANLPTPTILKPNQYFDVVTYTGNGGTKTISTSFDSDFVWVKNRSAAYSNVLNDRVRGNDKTLVSNSNTAEESLTGYMNFESLGSKQITFNYSGSGGPTGEWNYPGHNFVAWNWKAGGATTTNTNGAITSTVSANPTAGFSIAKFILNVANGASISWGHGLSSTPEMIIYKRTNSADSWLVYHTSVDANPNNYYLTLNSTNAKSNVNGWSAPATTTVGGINNWQNGDTVVAYSFDEIPGYSKFGSYTGNGSTDGPFVYTGFKPRFILFKRIDAGTEHWGMWDTARDTYNPLKSIIYSNLANSEADVTATYGFDVTSNGFKLRSNNSNHNSTGATYIYAAFAESVMVPTYPDLADVITPTATSTTETTVVLGGTVESTGNGSITARGTCYGTTPAPTTNCVAEGGTTTGVFTHTRTGLATSTTYYYRAYATNAYGTSYSDDSTFTTEGTNYSLLLDSSQTQYLNRTFSSPTNNKKYTFSTWVKRSKMGTQWDILSANNSGTESIYFNTDDTIIIRDSASGLVKRTAQVFRDPATWYHIVLAVDTTVGTAAERNRLYINGVENTSWVTNTTDATQNNANNINSAIVHRMGTYNGSLGLADGYQNNTYFIDGQQLTPSYFGQTSTTTSLWIPKAYSGTYGNNGFRLNFSNASSLGADSSGNGNNWTLNGGITSANNQVIDTPLNNFATLNPIDGNSWSGNAITSTFSKASTKATHPNAGTYTITSATYAVKSGKWYGEFTVNSLGSELYVGIASPYASYTGKRRMYSSSGSKNNESSTTAFSSSYTTNDVIGVAMDLDNGNLEFFKNGSSVGVAYTDLISSIPQNGWTFATFGYNGASVTFNAGQKTFSYSIPLGYKALSTANLPVPNILKPNQHFDTVTYTGNSSSKSISTLNFKPDLVWIKGRSYGSSNHIWNDAVRGPNKTIFSNQSLAEYTDRGVESFDTNGFSMSGTEGGDANADTQTYVAWNWLAGNATTSNTAGSITSTTSVNLTAGFSIIDYKGTGANGTVGHGLGSIPNFIIFKQRSGGASSGVQDWGTYHSSVGATGAVRLNLNNASVANSTYFNNATPTATVINLGSFQNYNELNGNFIAYAFTEVPSYSKFGSYTGNGNSDGAFVYTGFKPRYILTKRIDSGTEHWNIFDTSRAGYNSANYLLYTNLANADDTTTGRIDILSNGFKARDNGSGYNSTGATYIYAAFAESIMIPTVPATSSQESGSSNLEDLTVTPNSTQATIDYTIPSNPAFTEVVVVRSTSAITDTPSNGATYSVNDVIGSATVACVDSTIATSTYDSCIATGLSNSTAYYFKAFTKSGTTYTEVPTIDGSPSTPNVGASNVTVTSYRIRTDNGDESSATYSHAENTPVTTNFISGDKVRVRFVVTNHTTSLINKRYQLEYSSNACSSWTAVPTPGSYTNEHWRIDTSSYVSDSASTTHSGGISVPNGKAFKTGRIQTFSSLTNPIVLHENDYTEIEYLIRSTTNTTPGANYCFRVTHNGDASDFTYSATPGITTMSRIFRYKAGGGGGGRTLNYESSSVATTTVTGGSADGSPTATSTITEPTATSTTQQSTTTPTRRRGGGGSVGTLYNNSIAQTAPQGIVLGASTELMCTNMKHRMLYGKKDSTTQGEVSELQYYLQQQGYFRTKVTGNFLSITENAVEQFQNDNNLPVTGIVDEATRTMMREMGCVGVGE